MHLEEKSHLHLEELNEVNQAESTIKYIGKNTGNINK